MSSYHSQEQTLAQLPVPSTEQIAQSAALVDVIIADIEQCGGVISFAQYMNHVLYHPGLGYYSAGLSKFGASGDFVTAPEISSLFGATLARQCSNIFAQGCARQIFEFGAGSGKLCEQLIENLPALNRYLILEISADLRDRQRTYLKGSLTPAQFEKVIWLNSMPETFDGIVIGNEVLDAMPVNVVLKNPQWHELGIGFDGAGFVWREYDIDSPAVEAIKIIENDLGELPSGYCTEVNLNYLPWLKALNSCCSKAVILMIDYGYEQTQYYHPERISGSLICHYRHRAHPDPLVYPGLQDITAFVDFDAFADAATLAEFEISGLTTQGQFLLSNGLLEEAQKLSHVDDPVFQTKLSQQIKTLTLPGEMGDRFKVIALQKNLNLNLPAFNEKVLNG